MSHTEVEPTTLDESYRRSRAAIILLRLEEYVEVNDKEAALAVICQEIEVLQTYPQLMREWRESQ